MGDQKSVEIPKRAKDLMERGINALERKNFNYAMDMFMAALDIEPRFLQARKLLRAAAAGKYRESGEPGPLAAALGGVFGLVSGFIALKSGKNLKALQTAEELLRKHPFYLPFLRLACKAAEAAGMPDAAIITLVQARERYTDNAEIFSWLGRLYTAVDQLEEARACFERAVELRPNDALAMQDFKDAMARDSMLKGGWRDVAAGDGSYRSIIKDAREAAALEEQEKSASVERNLDLLIAEAEDKSKRAPENITQRRALANLYVQATRFDDAISVIEEGRKMAGAGDPVMDQLLTAIRVKQMDSEIARYKREGNAPGAEKLEAKKQEFLFNDLSSRVKQYPNDLALRFDYGLMLFERRQFNEAIQQLQFAERNPVQRIRSLYYIALCFKEKGQLDLAKDQLEKAAAGLLEMDDMKKNVFYQLGLILESEGETNRAVEDYYKAIYQVDIGFKDVADKIEAAYRKNQQDQ